MKLEKVTIEGFRSFKEPQTLNLASLNPGLYYVSGVNEIEKTLEGNGAGKSSLFESVYWALYGKTSRNVRGENVRAWDYKGPCRVTLKSSIGTLRRERGPRGTILEVNAETVDQKTLEHRIGLSPEAFLHCLYFAQFSPYFIDLTPSARMQIYSELMNLEFWEDKAKRASEAKTEFEGVMVSLEKERMKEQGILDELQRTRSLVKTERERWDTEQTAKLQKAKQDVAQAKRELQQAEQKVQFAKGKLQETRREAERFERLRERQKQAVEDLRRKVGKAKERRAIHADRMQNLSHALNRFAALGGFCDHCQQKVDPAHKQKHLQRLQKEMQHLKETMEKEEKDQKELEASLAQRLAELESMEGPNVALFVSRYESACEHEKACQTQLSERIRSLENLRGETNPWKEKERWANERRKETLERISVLKTGAAEADWYSHAFDFWVKGMKDIRLFIVRESLEQLNAEVNESLLQLGLKDWRIMFELEKETKSGTVKRGFACSIHSPHTNKEVEWETWSGGESQRLRLAVQLGISNLLTARAGIRPNVEFFDEPSSWLSEAGIKDLLGVLEERALRYERRVLIADHRVLDYPFSGEIRVTKSSRGSHIELL